ncbi:hypothetical protein CAPTEDRAFT_89526, partial [Capitella teleta]
RCVPESQRSFAMGVKWVFMRFLGTVLGPAVYGYLFDDACLIWQESCGERGSCWIYDGDTLAWNLIAISVAVKFVGCVSFALSLFIYKPPHTGESGELAPQPSPSEGGYANPALDEDDSKL